LSEQANIAYLQERIKEATRLRTLGFIFFALGAIFCAISVVLYVVSSSVNAPMQYSLVAAALSVGVAVIGIFFVVYENGKKERLMKELESLGHGSPICPRCGKQIPEGNYTFCPFCGSPLTPPPP
jgi:uncharacterized membrane protein